jgi:hypothetical protein
MKEESKMKRFGSVSIVFLVLLMMLSVGNAWSIVSLPTANFSGNATTTAGVGTGSLTLVSAVISQVNYVDGTSTSVNTVEESILGMDVTISGASRISADTFADAVLKISDGTFNYFSSTLSDVMLVTDGTSWFLNPGLDANNASTLNLSMVVLNTDATHPSRFIDELQAELGSGSILGMKMILTLLSGAISGDSSSDIFTGLIDGVPQGIQVPSGARTIGYWKNHDEERQFYDDIAVDLSSVFDTTGGLFFYLTKKGKKTMEEKALQQLAALLLNCASSLPVTTQLSTGELEIYNLIVEPDVTMATVEDAKTVIENVINTTDAANMENAKDLADEINNRDHGGN